MVADSQTDNPIVPPASRASRRVRFWEMTVLAVLTVCFGIVIGAGGVFLKYRDRIAPRQKFDEGMLWRIVHEMRGRYDLTDEQVQKVRETFRTQFEKMRTLRTEIEEQMEQIRAELIVQMKDILDAEQFKQWRQDLDRMQQRGGWRRTRGQGQGQGQGPPTPDQMIRRATEGLGLTDEQKAAIKQIAEKYDKAFKENKDPERGAELFKKMWDQVNSVLTEDQRQKMQERMSRFGPGQGRGGPRSRDESGPGRSGPRPRGEPGPGPQGPPPDQRPPGEAPPPPDEATEPNHPTTEL